MTDALKGKKTAVAAVLVALYGAVRAFWPDKAPNLPDGWEEAAIAVIFFGLRLVTNGPHTLTAKPEEPDYRINWDGSGK